MYRQIVDLGDLDRSRWIPPPPGQQEQLLSAHYADLAAPWLAGRYRAMSWTRAQVAREAESTLILEPPAP
jgi:acyl-homoserine lactone acylase PvdQ